MSILRDMRAPYTAFEAWFYDRFVSVALSDLASRFADWIAGLPKGACALDVGCGGGQLVIGAAAKRNDVRFLGVDFSMDQCQRAKRRAGLTGPSFVRASALALPFAHQSFDLVISVASLKHWPDPRQGLRECARVLAPAGRLLVAEVDRGCRNQDAREFVARCKIPRACVPVALALFRTYVAGESLDADDARIWLGELGLQSHEVRRIAGTPGLLLEGRAQ